MPVIKWQRWGLLTFLLFLITVVWSSRDSIRESDGRLATIEATLELLQKEAHASNPEIWAKLGYLTSESKNSDEYLVEILDAFNSAMSHAEDLMNVGEEATQMRRLACMAGIEASRTLIRMHRYADALGAVEHALVLSDEQLPLRSLCLYEQGRALSLLGQGEDAFQSFSAGMAIWPPYTQHCLELSRLALKGTITDARYMLELTSQALEQRVFDYIPIEVIPGSSPPAVFLGDGLPHVVLAGSEADMHYAIGMTADRLGLYDVVWNHVKSGHHLVRRSQPSGQHQEPPDYDRDVASIQRIFQASFWPQGVGSPSRDPVFIIGVEGCGSEILEWMLSSHSSVFGVGGTSVFNAELPVIRDVIVSATIAFEQDVVARKSRVQTAVLGHADRIIDAMYAKANGSLYYSAAAPTTKHGAGSSIRSRLGQSNTRLVDRMLSNFLNVGFIHLLYPHATIVHVVRDPLDTLLSAYMRPGVAADSWSTDLDELVTYYLSYLRLMAHWRSVLPGRIVEVQFEELVYRPAPPMRRLIEDTMQLPWEEALCALRRDKRVGRPEQFSVVRTVSFDTVENEADPRALGRWKRSVPCVHSSIHLCTVSTAFFVTLLPSTYCRGQDVWPMIIKY